MIKNTSKDDSPIIFYYYFDLSDPIDHCNKLKERFIKSGHTREIEFRSWDCYSDRPGKDGDIYCYDAFVLSTLVDEEYIRQLPDIIDTSKVFPNILERSSIRGKIYGIPIMSCANVVICREEDDFDIKNVFDLPKGSAIPMQSMIMTYYLYAIANYQSSGNEVIKAIKYMRSLISDEHYSKSRFKYYDGIKRFDEGECKYLLGFTEDIRHLKKRKYKVHLLNMSDSHTNDMPLLPTDFASIGKHVREEKLLDCIDLLEILSDSDFIYDSCFSDGKLQYMLPSDKTLYPRLAETDPIYNDFFELMNNENNGILRFGKHFYEKYLDKQNELLKILNE